jgi:DNA repair exonuclease SbcCD ATPase subunit
MIKLGRMRLENFKSFIEPVEFNFTGSDLVLFDGPNGFGKTTIFDAVELCFTGEISRVKHTDSKVKKDHILKGYNAKPTTIQLELLNGTETLLVIGVHIPADISGVEGKVSNYRNVIERFEAESWQGDLDFLKFSKETLDVDSLKRLLNNEKIDSTFTLFNYIQQEETCHFLKLDEIKRHQQISHLFGTIEETNKADKLEVLSAKLKKKIDDYYAPLITKEKDELAQLSKPTTEEGDKKNHLGSGKVAAFSDLSSSTVEQLEAFEHNLEGIDWILKNVTDFKVLKFNYSLEKLVTQCSSQISNYIKVGATSSYEEIEKLNKQYFRWVKTKGKAGRYKALVDEYELEPNTLSKDNLNKLSNEFESKAGKFTEYFDSFDSLMLGNDSCNTMLATIDASRKNLLTHYEGHIGHEEDDGNKQVSCPLCGDQKEKWQDLLDEYNIQTERFEDKLGDSGKLLAALTKKLLDEFVAPLVAKMKRFITRYEKYISYDFETLIRIKFIERADFEKMELVAGWIALNIENSSSFQDKGLRDVKPSYSDVEESFKSFILGHKKSVLVDGPKSYMYFSQDLKALNLVFDEDGALTIDSNDIVKDLSLLSRLIVQKNSVSYKDKKTKLAVLQEKVQRLTVKRKEISAISKVYKDEIKAYEKEVAKHIAIPLFVYSSKILQSRPEGSGVFLITPERSNVNGFMQFSATPNDSHDAWNTMSSGQLAGVVISFMLAMNKVYPSNLSTLMIDDPVQTMDEVNMASFVQMMRYEFPKMQVLLSTHESKVANYFHYKYCEAGLKSLPINMKNKRLETVD